MSSSGSGRSAGSSAGVGRRRRPGPRRRRPGCAGRGPWTEERTGWRPPGPPWRVGRLVAHARRRRLGPRRVRPEGDPARMSWQRSRARRRRPRDLRRRGTSVDYPDYGGGGRPSGRPRVGAELGVCVCGTGIGISMAANKVARRPRPPWSHDVTTATLATRHNHANVVCFGGRITGHRPIATATPSTAVPAGAPEEPGRHERPHRQAGRPRP